jgi:spermidine synthase
MLTKRGTAWLVLPLFFCSGATALIYEVVWSKFLAQMLGSTVQAQTVVLAVFMGGLAMGNWLVGGRADRLSEPLRCYGFIELAIGLYAFCFVWLYGLADSLFVSVGTRVLERGWLLLSLKGGLSVGLLLVPTVLMGGTLPLLAAWLRTSTDDAGRCSARFYSVNSLGAVAGAGLAGFYLVRTLGMIATLQITALANAIIGGLALLLSQRSEATDRRSAGSSDPLPPRTLLWAGSLAAVSGGVSMGLEVLASRSMALIFGSSLQAVAIVLMAFILGIGVGSAVVASPRFRREQSESLLVFLLIGAALWIGLLVFKIESWVEFYLIAKTGLARTSTGYVYYQMLAGLLSIVVLGVPAALIGSVLPVLIRSIASQVAMLGEQVGRLLTWNTFGAVSGVMLTGFGLMPHMGLRGSFGLLAIGLCLAAFVIAWRRAWRGGASLAGVVMGLLAASFILGGLERHGPTQTAHQNCFLRRCAGRNCLGGTWGWDRRPFGFRIAH